MPFSTDQLRRLARLALVAMLAVALWPSFVRAQGHGGATAWVEVCTAQGMAWVPVPASATPHAAGPADGSGDASTLRHAALDHCTGCFLGHAPALPGPTGLRLPAPPPLGDALPPLFLDGPRTLHAGCSPPSRGPPAAS